jgi:hypothetical protein
MGEVYRERNSRLGLGVALKVAPKKRLHIRHNQAVAQPIELH